MAVITPENRDAWQELANSLSAQRPSKGKTVRILEGKHKGKEGKVFFHAIDKWNDAYRYCNEAQAHMRDMAGRFGWRVGVKTPSGETFFTIANNTEVVMPTSDEG